MKWNPEFLRDTHQWQSRESWSFREVPKILSDYLSTMFEPGFSLGVHAFFRDCPEDCTTLVDVDMEWYKPTISRRLSKTRENLLNVKNMFDFSHLFFTE